MCSAPRSVTVIEPGRAFFPAEGYHQDFLTRNPYLSYIVINDLPKIEALKRLFPDSYRVEPVLVANGPAPRTDWQLENARMGTGSKLRAIGIRCHDHCVSGKDSFSTKKIFEKPAAFHLKVMG